MLVGLVLLASSCASPDGGAISETGPSLARDQATTSESAPSEVATTQTVLAPSLPSGPSALDDRFHDEFPDPVIDPSEIISGGPPPDGIPPVDEPVFIPVAENPDILPPSEPVVALEIHGDARAYPVRAMVWHEIVNDVVGGVPVSVTYCPLCNSAATYERVVRGHETTFGTSGMLFASALVMYDRATESLWTHYNGEAVVGLLAGERLVEHPSPLLSWEDFRTNHEGGLVLDWTRTGFERSYGTNPYVGYDDVENAPFLFRGSLDDRAVAMQRVIGIKVEDSSLAIPLALASGDGSAATVTSVDVGDRSLIVLWKPGQASALDTSTLSGGYGVGSVGVFESVADGAPLSFTAAGGRFLDEQTGSVWTITGVAVEGPLSGSTLERVPHLDTFWFAWSTYEPGTELLEG